MKPPNPRPQAVILQPIHLLPAKAGQPAAQIVKHRFVGEILCIQGQSALDVLYHGIEYDPPGSVDKAGNLHLGKLRLHIGGISRQIPHDHRNIPKGKSLLPHQPADLKPCLSHLVPGGGGLKQPDLLLLLLIGANPVAEQILLQIPQGRGMAEAVIFIDKFHPLAVLTGQPAAGRIFIWKKKYILPALHTAFFCQTAYIRHGLLAQIEELLLPVQYVRILPGPKGEHQNHFPAPAHQLCYHPVLHGGKAGKAVKHHHAPRQKFRFMQGARKHIQCLLRGDEISPDILRKAPVQGLQILQLLRQRPPVPGILYQLPHVLRADAVLHELRNRAFYLMDIALPVQEAPQCGQAVFQICRHLLKHKAFPRIVQYRNLSAAHLLQNAVPQAPEAEHIDIQNSAPVI